MKLIKDATILSLMKRLDVPRRGWIIVDSWAADECAVGVARSGNPRRLVYISTFGMASDRYAYECEEPAGFDETDYVTTDRGAGVTFEALLKAIESHLGS